MIRWINLLAWNNGVVTQLPLFMVAVKAVVMVMAEEAATAYLKSPCLLLSLGILHRNLEGPDSTWGKGPSLLHLYFQDFC